MLRQKLTSWQFGLLLITLISCGLITAPADGATGAALTNIFTLDTRLTPTIQTITLGSGTDVTDFVIRNSVPRVFDLTF